MKPDSDYKTGLSQEKWLGLAIDAMAKSCKSKFSLDSLLKTMPVSKGSFYWHFKNRADFLAALVDQKRYSTVRQLFAEMGLEGDALDMRTLVFITATSMDQLLSLDISDESYEHQLKLRHEFFVRP